MLPVFPHSAIRIVADGALPPHNNRDNKCVPPGDRSRRDRSTLRQSAPQGVHYHLGRVLGRWMSGTTPFSLLLVRTSPVPMACSGCRIHCAVQRAGHLYVLNMPYFFPEHQKTRSNVPPEAIKNANIIETSCVCAVDIAFLAYTGGAVFLVYDQPLPFR